MIVENLSIRKYSKWIYFKSSSYQSFSFRKSIQTCIFCYIEMDKMIKYFSTIFLDQKQLKEIQGSTF